MKIFILCISVLLLFSFSTPDSDSKRLTWSTDYKLEWADFRGGANLNSFGDALSTITISAKPYLKNRKLNYDVHAYFLRNESWYKDSSRVLLAHEQLHFDLAELYARKVRQQVKEYQRAGVKDFKFINNRIQEILKQSSIVDAQYDRETMHGALTKKQNEWKINVEHQLQALSSYK